MSAVGYPHIEILSDGVPIIEGTRTKVAEIVLDQLAHDWDADEIHRQHPDLSLAQIHAALTYYYDHQEEIDREIERGMEKAEEIKKRLGISDIRVKLKAAGKLP